ncbi:hypothetical protein [Deinococcus radiodurans]|jgi:hypothetical protein|nr:hypothetical protein [Deinococcus radiodurans]ANC71542.1 hypothetical protein A2G07_07030 [Deinococcus radiodurans R1 = ATCC 13939 = DSM 20539]QIP29345.1 hypothetical protein HAV23_09425 [Deinococcus radiodurans]QIP31959.1 hypothetical protein HAV35_07375 [Deinococcus radiodurans]UID70287.1 hypothetical protein DRO_1290 [Deinococcus radiodurans R1 = ATCC 13939 = DSM 20539]UTA50780.1 hypothetical protein MSS93_14245 [Deinococcus radiodurans]
MNLDSWTPTDKARRLATLIAAYLATSAGLIAALGLHWPWYLALLSVLVLYGVLYVVGYAVLKAVFRA